MGRAAFKAVELLLKWLVGSTPTSSAKCMLYLFDLKGYLLITLTAIHASIHTAASKSLGPSKVLIQLAADGVDDYFVREEDNNNCMSNSR